MNIIPKKGIFSKLLLLTFDDYAHLFQLKLWKKNWGEKSNVINLFGTSIATSLEAFENSSRNQYTSIFFFLLSINNIFVYMYI